MMKSEHREEADNKQYIDAKVSPILEPMVEELLKQKPENPLATGTLEQVGKRYFWNWIIWLDKSHEEVKGGQGDDDYVDELPASEVLPQKRGPRTSVSAEAYGVWNKKENFKAKVIPKPEESRQKIMTRLNQAFMFGCLSDQEKNIVIDAMEEKKVKAGETVINQGEDGEALFLIETGTLDCYKKFAGAPEPKYLKTYVPGEAFGELALLYNAPRAATIKAKEDSLLWGLDRGTFNFIVKDAASKKRERYEEFLSKVKLLSSMDSYERSKIADAFKAASYKEGDYIIKQGEIGDIFYFIESGTAVATKGLEKDAKPKEVMQYKPGDYFGELALLKNEPRAANVVATSEVDVVSLDRNSFKRLLGPLEEILKRNIEVYNQYC